jgi:hypothetical protein
MVPGAPYLPPHSRSRRLRYVVVAILMSTFGIFGNSLVTENLQQVAGGYSSYSAELVWLTAAYVGVGASSNVVMIKGRMQLGLPLMLYGSLVLYALAAAADATWGTLFTAILSRAANGLSTSTGVATSVYCLMQALPKNKRILAIATPIACVQLAQPLARLVPVDFLTLDSNTTLHLLTLLIPLLQILLLALNPLPRTYTQKVFEPVDLITGVLVVSGAMMLACALAAGQTYWWNDAPFLGQLLIGAIITLGLALMVEARRQRPEINLQWLSRRHILGIMAIALVERVSLSVQTSSVPGLLALRSLNNDQYHHLFALVALAMFVGILVMLKTLGPKALLFQMVAALGCIAMGALIACASNSLVRPDDLILSQCLIGFGATLFAGPALLACISQVLQRGAEVLVPTVLVFAAVQNFGTLIGTALLSSVQYLSQQTAIAGYANRFRATSPLIAPWHSNLSDLSSSAQQQAAVIGYLNSFRLVAVIALVAMLAVLATALYSVYTTRAAAEGSPN